MAVGTEELVRLTDRQNTITSIEAGLLVLAIFFSAWASIAASRAARAADKAVRVSSDTAGRQLRAYVHVSTCYLVMDKDGGVESKIKFKNVGQTPAYNVVTRTSLTVAPYPLQGPLEDPPKPEKVSRATVGAGLQVENDMSLPRKLAPDYVSDIAESKGAIFVHGAISYDDIFAHPHKTRFCLVYMGHGAASAA